MGKRELSPDENLHVRNHSSKKVMGKRKPATTVERCPSSDESSRDDNILAPAKSSNSRNITSSNGSKLAPQLPANPKIPDIRRSPQVSLVRESLHNLQQRGLARKSLMARPSPLSSSPQVSENGERPRHREGHHRDGRLSQTPYGRKRQSTAIASPARLNTLQLKDLYSNCLKLAHSNKINLKNAFSLPLIDYMSTLMQNNDTNFNLATNTLDAGTKIYVNRVDSVHQDAQKVANGLVLALDNKQPQRDSEDEEENQEMDEDGVPKPPKQKKAKKKKSVNTITTKEALTAPKLDQNNAIDPVFYKLTTASDMGTVTGLFMSNLRISCRGEMLIDASLNIRDHERRAAAMQVVTKCSVAPFVDNFKAIRDGQDKICPQLSNFVFHDRDDDASIFGRDLEDSTSIHHDNRLPSSSAFAFDLEAEVEPVNMDTPEPDGDLFDGLDFGGGFDNDDMDSVDGDEPIAPRKSIMRALNIGNLDALPDLLKILADQPDDYTYFNKKLTGAWAGPHFWKPNRFAQYQKPAASAATSGMPTARKARKQYELISFQEDFDERDSTAVRDPKRLRLKMTTLTKWSETASEITLPDDYHFDLNSLFECFNVKGRKYRCMIKENKTVTPARSLDEDSDDESIGMGHDMPMSPGHGDGFDGGDHPPGFETQPFSTQFATQQEGAADMFVGDNLVDEPFQVQTINLPYAKFAKQMDVKKLKRAMNDIISPASPAEGDGESASGTTFSKLYSLLPTKITTKMTNNLSAPIAFVALLHLCNEKNLSLEGRDDFSDFLIKAEKC